MTSFPIYHIIVNILFTVYFLLNYHFFFHTIWIFFSEITSLWEFFDYYFKITTIVSSWHLYQSISTLVLKYCNVFFLITTLFIIFQLFLLIQNIVFIVSHIKCFFFFSNNSEPFKNNWVYSIYYIIVKILKPYSCNHFILIDFFLVSSNFMLVIL